MTVISVEGMHCEHCVARIEKALGDAGLKFSVSLAEKSVTIDGDKNAVSLAVSEIEDLGFGAAIR